MAFAVVAATPALAARPHKHRAAQKTAAEKPPPPLAVPLDQIHVLGGIPAPFELEAKAAYLIDVDTGAVLYAYAEHQKMQPASLAKIMTFYLALNALKAGKISLDTKMPVSEQAWRLSVDQTVSHMFLEVGQQVAVRDLLYGLMVSSGNDAAVVVAEYLGGSAESFTKMMNDEAARIGLSETHFDNPDGLPAEGEYTTASDMVKLGHTLLRDHPEALTYTSAKEFTFHDIVQRNFNTLLFYDARVDGIKTGHVDEAGYHLVASAKSNGMRLISAVMGTKNMEKRRLETDKLLDWAFRTFVDYRPNLKASVPASLPVRGGVAETVAIGPATDAVFTLPRGEETKAAIQFTPAAAYLEAPVPSGSQVGEISITLAGKPIATVPVVTQAGVGRAGFFERMRQKLHRAL
ncbi:MAG TPA: D-alanyl-D-alanine carboxypeptidase family protein [Candidatus Binataceae bacterium]|nr:D-alanyl-D-alanine carboxypeptidase family protein [Candidatus Binataceae bacterium]